MTDEQIKRMVNRFLGWKLPGNFSPDGGISFKAEFNEHTAYPMKHEPSGTNLFDASQTEAMVRYMIDGLPYSRGNSPLIVPSYGYCVGKVGAGDASALERFIYDNEPAGASDTEWRESLGAVIAEAQRAAADGTPTT